MKVWISKFKHTTSYRAIDLYVNPYLKSYLTKGIFSTRWKWMKKYRVRVSLVGDDKISLNEFHVTLAGSEVDITDAVLQGASLDELLERHELEELKGSKPDSDQLEYTKKKHQVRAVVILRIKLKTHTVMINLLRRKIRLNLINGLHKIIIQIEKILISLGMATHA